MGKMGTWRCCKSLTVPQLKFAAARLDVEVRVSSSMLLADASWLLMVPQERLKNDGRGGEPGEQIQTPRLVSVNDPTNTLE